MSLSAFDFEQCLAQAVCHTHCAINGDLHKHLDMPTQPFVSILSPVCGPLEIRCSLALAFVLEMLMNRNSKLTF